MEFTLNVADCEVKMELVKVSSDTMIAPFITMGNVRLTRSCAYALWRLLNDNEIEDFDFIVTAETKSIPLAHELSALTGVPYIVARKSKKLYDGPVASVDVKSITTDFPQKLSLSIATCKKIRYKKVIIIDDVISTGDSLNALERLMRYSDAEVVEKLFVLAEGDAIGRTDIRYLAELPLFNLDGSIKSKNAQIPTDVPL